MTAISLHIHENRSSVAEVVLQCAVTVEGADAHAALLAALAMIGQNRTLQM
jgi:hypothetical protein